LKPKKNSATVKVFSQLNPNTVDSCNKYIRSIFSWAPQRKISLKNK